MGCIAGFGKWVLIILNFVFLLFGGACLGLGIWAMVDTEHKYLGYLTKLSDNVTDLDVPSLLQSAAIVLIVVGSVILFIAICGCIGASKLSCKCLLYVYATILVVIVLLQVAAIVLNAIFASRIESEAKAYLKRTLDEEYKGPYNTADAVSLAWDYVMVSFECCGVDGSSDFNATAWDATYINPLDQTSHIALRPLTCCKFSEPADTLLETPDVFIKSMLDKTCPYTAGADYNKDGCYETLKDTVQMYSHILLGISVGVLAVEVLCIIFAILVIRANKEV